MDGTDGSAADEGRSRRWEGRKGRLWWSFQPSCASLCLLELEGALADLSDLHARTRPDPLRCEEPPVTLRLMGEPRDLELEELEPELEELGEPEELDLSARGEEERATT